MIINSKENQIRMNQTQFSGSTMKREMDILLDYYYITLIHYSNELNELKSHHQITIDTT